MPENWLHAGVLRAMLPGATVIETRRDRLETAWSCYKQPFYRLQHFSCDLDNIAAFMGDCERAMDTFRTREPGHVNLPSHEPLQVSEEGAIRALHDHCEIHFAPGRKDKR